MSVRPQSSCDLAVIGTGMAGMAAALFAANRGLSVLQVGRNVGFLFASGLLDLMAVHPVQTQTCWQDPWAAIDALIRDVPDHPYARLSREQISSAFSEILEFLEHSGLPYHCQPERNSDVLTALGTVKRTYCVPRTMQHAVTALAQKPGCLLVDFLGLKDFSARQIVATMGERWPGLRAIRIRFPGAGQSGELLTGEIWAQKLDLPENRRKLAEAILPHLEDASVVGFPAILGLYRTAPAMADLETQLGVPIFEIPTMPPSMPGMRLRLAFEHDLPAKGVRLLAQKLALGAIRRADGDFSVEIGSETEVEHTVRARGIILATGRFLGKGLHADSVRIREPLFGLHVYQPASRSGWHKRDLFDGRGHCANQAGLEIDSFFRPLDAAAKPAFENLFAAGSILAHQDWMRMKCGSGLSIATAYGAVAAFAKVVGGQG